MTKIESRKSLKKLYDEAALRAAYIAKHESRNLVGIFVHGSVARSEPGPFSDIDLVSVIKEEPKPADFSYFDGDIYVGMGFVSVAELKKEFKDPNSFFWARGSAEATRILYDPRGILRRIMLRWKRIEPPRQLLEKSLWDEYHNIIEYSGKLRNGWLKQDEYLTRYSARIIAEHAQRAIIALNQISIISENYTWKQVLRAKKRPKHLRTDYPLALGIVGTLDTSRIFKSAMRLCGETLRLIKSEFFEKAKQARFRKLLAEPLEKHGL